MSQIIPYHQNFYQYSKNNQNFSLINIILFELIFILLPKSILLDDPYIELKVKSTGYHQILSEKYSGLRPSAIYVNNEVQIMKDFKVYVESIEHKIRIEWLNKLTDFTYMFSNLSNITSVTMNKITGFMSNMSYMFYNCQSLESIFSSNDILYVNDMRRMFYNCYSLSSFDITNFCSNNTNNNKSR